MKTPLSVIIPVYNEEKKIEDCLKSVSWADQIIVVDGGSSDRTREIAAPYTQEILTTENAPAETQRLKAFDRVKNQWFLLLDADERVTEELRKSIDQVIHSKSGASAYYLLRRNFYLGQPVYLHHPDHQLRLFKKEEVGGLPARIHRIPKVAGTTGRLRGELKHLFFTSIEDYLKKLNRYTDIEVSYWRAEGRKIDRWNALYYMVLRPAGRFFQYYFFKKGILDGFFGFFYSLTSAFYETFVAARFLLDDDPTRKQAP